MNNKDNNMFAENTFTFENNKNDITNELIEILYEYIVNRIEELKYGTPIINEIPNFDAVKANIAEERKKAAQSWDANVANTNKFVPTEEQPSGEKCEICGGYFDHLTYCQIKDSFGARFRNICDDCIVKHNAKPKK